MSDNINIIKNAVVLILFVGMLFFGYVLQDQYFLPPDDVYVPVPEVKTYADLYYDRVVTPGEFESTAWILNNTNKSDTFANDIWGAELIMGMTTRVSTVGGDYANSPDWLQHMEDSNKIYISDDMAETMNLIRRDNVTLIFLPLTRNLHVGWQVSMNNINYSKFDDPAYFTKVYENQDVRIYRVL
jgi:hypothetical protein